MKSSVIGTATTIFFMTFSGEDTKTRPRDRSQHNGKVKLVFEFFYEQKTCYCPYACCCPSEHSRSYANYHNLQICIQHDESTQIDMSFYSFENNAHYHNISANVHTTYFFLNKGFLQYNRVAKTVKLRILYSIVYEGIAKGNKLSPLNDDVSTLL